MEKCKKGGLVHADNLYVLRSHHPYNNGEHNPPHFYASYQDFNAVFNFDGDMTDGDMPSKQRKLIAAWTEIRKDELLANWELAMNEQPLYRIEPLR